MAWSSGHLSDLGMTNDPCTLGGSENVCLIMGVGLDHPVDYRHPPMYLWQKSFGIDTLILPQIMLTIPGASILESM